GTLIIEGGLDEVPEIKDARERIFVFQQIPYTDAGTLEGTDFEDRIVGWSSLADRHTTINGLSQPVIDMAPGEAQRGRFGPARSGRTHSPGWSWGARRARCHCPTPRCWLSWPRTR